MVVQDSLVLNCWKIEWKKEKGNLTPAQTKLMQNSAPKQEVEMGYSAMSIIVFV
jgi:hypothetical protein